MISDGDARGRSRGAQIFGAGVSLGMLAGILLGSLVTLWLGDAAVGLAHRIIERISGRSGRINFELLQQ